MIFRQNPWRLLGRLRRAWRYSRARRDRIDAEHIAWARRLVDEL